MANILIVDDNEALAALWCDLLAAEGHIVQNCAAGAQAAEKLAQAEVDLMVLDEGLPDMSGLDLLETASQALGGAKVLMVSGKPPPSNFNAAAKNVSDWLVKPVDLFEFHEAVTTLCAA